MPTKYRIAVVTSIHPDFDFRVWKHATSLVREGCDVHLVCPWEVEDGIILDGVSVHSFPRVEKRFFRPFLISYLVLKTLLPIVGKVDLIHFHDIDILPLMAMLALFKPVVYDVHENYADEMLVREWIPQFLRWPLFCYIRFIHFFLPLFIKNIVLVSPSQDYEFRSRYIRKIHIRNFASLRLLDEFKDDYMERANQIIFTGSHYYENGSMLLLDIAEGMKGRGISAQIVATDRFVSKHYRERFESLIRDRGLNNIRIIQCVPSDCMMSILNEATIAVLPQLRVLKSIKAIPTRIFEYMAASLPVVASDLDFLKEIISQDHFGLLAQPENPDKFVDAIEKLIKEKEFAHSLGINGQHAFMKKYSWESQIPALLEFYNAILSRQRS